MVSIRKPEHRRESESCWRDVIECWQRSGLSQVAFCRRERLKTYSFSHWKRKLLGQPRGPARARPRRTRLTDAFVPVRVAHRTSAVEPIPDWSCEIRFAKGVIVRLRDGPFVQELWCLGASQSAEGGQPCG